MPNEEVEGGLRRGGIRGKTRSSSSVEASVVGRLGLVIEAVDEAGSIEAMLLRMEGMDTRDKLRNGHEGGESGEMGLVRSWWFARGVGGASCSSSVGWAKGASEVERGDFLTSGVFRSFPFPSTVFLNEPVLFLLLGACAAAMALRPRELRSTPSRLESSVLSWSLFVRKNLEIRFPETDRLWPGAPSLRFLSLLCSRTSFSCPLALRSSVILGNGVVLSMCSELPFE